MIKEKHDKGPDTSSTAIKEEPATNDSILNKNKDNAETRIKTEEETATSSCSGAVSKDCAHPLTKNGATNVIGSTNTGSVHNLVDRKDPHLLDNVPEEGTPIENANPLDFKSEEGIETSKIQTDAFNTMGMPGPVPSHPPPPDGVQPLASNIINKQSSSVEVQYMQQQSQIFVFSTQLANKGADAVYQGHFPSIIAYHCAQPGTKKYLEKNPLKITQFNRQNPAQWLNNLAMMKNKGCTRSPSMMKPNNIDGILGPDSLDDMVAFPDSVDLPWEQKPNSHLVGIDNISNGGPMLPEVESSCHLRSSPGSTIPLGHSPIMTNASSASPSLSSMQPSLQGVKVPDENLTPQQRQHREEQLATIRKMQQMLFPEHQGMRIPPENAAGPENPLQDAPGAANLGPNGPIDLPPGDMCADNMGSGGNGPGIIPGTMGPTGMMPQRPMNVPIGPGGPPGNMPVSAQIEWQKLQHQFFEERKGRGQTNMVPCHNAPSVVSRVGQGAGPRLQGPPPPYHQTPRSASVPIALQSPSPASPNNPTSNLSLPSPRASSALNSPADPGRSFSLNRHLNTGQSPTSQDSPSTGRGLIPSNPSTPISSHLSPNSNLIVSTSQDFPPTSGLTSTTSTDGMFGRTLQSLAQQKQNMSTSVSSANTSSTLSSKEPNLMPVPSPQQIQYLNTFEGQELTIQKQPNTSLKDGNMISPAMIATANIDTGMLNTETSRLSGPNTPMTPSSMEMGPRFPSTSSDNCRYQMSSPQTASNGNPTPQSSEKNSRSIPSSCLSPQSTRTPGCPPDMLKQDISGPFGTTASPHGMLDVHRFQGPGSVGPTTSPGPFPQQQPSQQVSKIPTFMNISPSSKGPPPGLELNVSNNNYGCNVRSDNVPLNPNCTSTMSGNTKVSHFDPISSLAQMSQQLTNSVASSLNGQSQTQGSSMMNFSSPGMHMGVMDMSGCHGIPDLENVPGSCNMMMPMHGPNPHQYHQHHGNATGNSPMGGVRSLSPKMGSNPGGPPPGLFPSGAMPIPRMMGRPPGCNPYNGTNVQVKPNAPNTIQYLPAKPQMGNANPPRGPPSLDFLQRFANPVMSPNMEPKLGPGGNMQYFPGNCAPPNNGHMGGANVPHMGHMEGPPMTPDGSGGMMPGPMMNGMNNGPMLVGPPNMGMGGGMIPQGGMGMNMPPMMRGPGGMRGPGMVRMPQMGFNGPANGGGPPVDPNMFGGGPPNMANPNAQLFVSGPKASPMGMGAPDASQPLPPSIGQSASFKNSPFVGPTTADPNYAQQFHNFQQQLYATGTRSQMSNQAMVPGQPHSTSQQPYFVPK